MERDYKAVVKDSGFDPIVINEYGPFSSQEADCFLTGLSLGDIDTIEMWKERLHPRDDDTDLFTFDRFPCKRSHYRGSK